MAVDEVYALTLHQPWASAVAFGAKRVETRSWKTKHRTWIVIHAAKTKAHLDAIDESLLGKWAMECYLAGWEGNLLPLGAFVAVAHLDRVVEIDEPYARNLRVPEVLLGDYTAGRYAWEFDHIQPLPKPIQASGWQGLWVHEHPEPEIVAAIHEGERQVAERAYGA